MESKEITLTIREILDLAKATGLIVAEPQSPIDSDDMESEYTIIECKEGFLVGDENGKNPKPYHHVTYITEYPDEGTFPPGEPIPDVTASK